MKTILLISLLFVVGCEETEDTCPVRYLHGYETVTSEDGSSTTAKAIYRCYPPTTTL